MVYKKGSTGEEVKRIQTKVGVNADGVFGAITENRVKEWQEANGLVADGIVGNATWSKMFGGQMPNNGGKCVDGCVTYSPLNVHISKLQRTPKYIAIHFTAGSNSKPGRALSTKHTFEQRQASADFCVDDATIVQFNPDINSYYCWSVGDKKRSDTGGGSLYGIATNRNTISIEICSTCTPATQTAVTHDNHSGWSYTDAVLSNAIKLTKILMTKFGIDKDHVVRHYDISGKLCPGIVGWNNGELRDINGNKIGVKNNSSKWEWFKSQL